jgi:precorrin-3B synthase
MTLTLVQDLSTPTSNPSPQGGGESVRRGACPGLSAPMRTGDGLLVRLRPLGTMALSSFAGLCAAARTHGNGIIEVTARGSIQVRGLSEASAPQFAALIAALGIAAHEPIPILTNPLAGLAADDRLDAAALAEALRRELAHRSIAARLSPKISVAIDGGGVPSLDAIAADVRLRVAGRGTDAQLEIALGGDAASAVPLGCVAAADGAEAAVRLLEILARRGCEARARGVLWASGVDEFRNAIADLLTMPARPPEGGHPEVQSRLGGNERSGEPIRSSEAIGLHRLRENSFACGIGLAFGHCESSSLELLSEAASIGGAGGMRAAPGRTLLALGMTPRAVSAFAAAAERLGFIVRPDDPRRRIIACAGAPFCASGQLAARLIAPSIATAAAACPDRSLIVHISGCAKGCAHPSSAALTVVGTGAGCALIADGSARQEPFAVVAAAELPSAVADFVRERTRGEGHG